MNASKNAANDPVAHEAGQQKTSAVDKKATPAADTQPASTGAPEGCAANRGSPAAPAMKQFAKTEAERTGRP